MAGFPSANHLSDDDASTRNSRIQSSGNFFSCDAKIPLQSSGGMVRLNYCVMGAPMVDNGCVRDTTTRIPNLTGG
jgi:hypothetical protein